MRGATPSISKDTTSGITVERFVDRGLTPDEILKEPIEVTKQDPYPIGQRLFIHDERLTGMIVRNLHQRILEKKQQPTA